MFGGQVLQASGPDDDLYLLASQLVQSDPVGPVLPAGHKFEQSSLLSLPAGDDVWEGQSIHKSFEVDPRAPEYLPWPQSRQASAPAAVL